MRKANDWCAALLLLGGLSGTSHAQTEAVNPVVPALPFPAPLEELGPDADPDGVKHYRGMCDASAAVPLPGGRFLVANDEDNVLRVYAVQGPCEPLEMFGLNGLLQPTLTHPEADIEGATSIGQRTYWITSHGRNRNGNLRPSRYRFFALDWDTDGKCTKLRLVGKPYTALVRDLVKAPQLARYNLLRSSAIVPKEIGGLNIEGLTATPAGHLLIGFRNPIPWGRALVVPLLNPEAVLVEGCQAEFGSPIELDLGNLGIRSMEYWPARGVYLIVAGPISGRGEFRLYAWSGAPDEAPVFCPNADFGDLNPEAIVIHPDDPVRVQILSDDGTVQDKAGRSCGSQREHSRKHFRSLWVTP